MGLDGFKSWDLAIVKAIKELNIDNFCAITNNVVIDFKKPVTFPNQRGEMAILDYLSVVLKAKNRDVYLQSLFVSRIWEMFSSSKAQSRYMNDIALDVLPLLFLRERNESSLKKQISLFFKIIDKEPHDIFISKIPVLVNLFQNPFFSDVNEIINHLEKRKNGFDLIGFFKAKEQCYYQKEMVANFISYIKENDVQVSIDSLYRACSNINLNAVCSCRDIASVCWITYSPKSIQNDLETLLLSRLGLSDDYKKFLPLLVASKQYREWSCKDVKIAKSYLNFISCSVLDFYDEQDCDKIALFETLKRLNAPSDAYINLMNKYIIEDTFAKGGFSKDDCLMVEETDYKL